MKRRIALLGMAVVACARGGAEPERERGAARAPAAAPASLDAPARGHAEPFGYKSEWLAVKTAHPETVVELLQLRGVVPADWKAGLAAAYGGNKVFVTPVIDGWVLVLDASFVAFAGGDLLEKPELLADWSRSLGAPVQHYICDRRSGTFGWMRADGGRLTRAFLEVDGEVKTNLGPETADEKRARAEVIKTPSSDGAVLADGEDVLFRLAGRWSIDPHLLDQRTDLPASGLVGESPD